jgi:hypothetical protein
MDSIKINSGVKRIAINDDPERVITFNPTDIVFAEKFYKVLGEFQAQLKEYENKARAIEGVKEVDADGLPVNLTDRIGVMREVCEYFAKQVDYLFGAGTAQKVTEGAVDIEIYEQFFTGITPFIQKARADKVAQYGSKPTKRKL